MLMAGESVILGYKGDSVSVCRYLTQLDWKS
jgi:hypothetical protein